VTGPSRPRPDKNQHRNAITGAADDDRHADHRNALSQYFRILTNLQYALISRRYHKEELFISFPARFTPNLAVQEADIPIIIDDIPYVTEGTGLH